MVSVIVYDKVEYIRRVGRLLDSNVNYNNPLSTQKIFSKVCKREKLLQGNERNYFYLVY